MWQNCSASIHADKPAASGNAYNYKNVETMCDLSDLNRGMIAEKLLFISSAVNGNVAWSDESPFLLGHAYGGISTIKMDMV